MFQGASALNLDSKGRLAVPARHRDALRTEEQAPVTVTKHPDGCLLLFPKPEWEAFRNKIAALPMDAHWWRRIFLGNAFEVDLDSAGRVLIAPALRQAASLDREVMLLGMGSHFEIWDAATYAAKEQAAIAQGMPEALKNFSF
ncbi:division/cell wall cluster transcriptional repressor MraZ [Chitinasiproducens palmae]|uniref:Transcriptional regulator MraZ n=1 Tax=Chitinasiproducens palmae TaxID=1770053 RepID=A0A1H2PRR4_9BURK|nr:division/cell wall cluster transcriptional repressor MraZ [Chitinasiproducens palmae]SDV49599.1 MraZ protein [Chitinasiproducens palmae]